MSIVKLTVRPVDEENHRDISVVSMDNEVIGYICPTMTVITELSHTALFIVQAKLSVIFPLTEKRW
ncbi:TPA_asm: hypothetical protein G0G79_13055 [Salmonella enterica]|nr:hypothetical protein [Salmonella enterica]HAC8265616.1 hypothetical protein [Salmonella enterica]